MILWSWFLCWMCFGLLASDILPNRWKDCVCFLNIMIHILFLRQCPSYKPMGFPMQFRLHWHVWTIAGMRKYWDIVLLWRDIHYSWLSHYLLLRRFGHQLGLQLNDISLPSTGHSDAGVSQQSWRDTPSWPKWHRVISWFVQSLAYTAWKLWVMASVTLTKSRQILIRQVHKIGPSQIWGRHVPQLGWIQM